MNLKLLKHQLKFVKSEEYITVMLTSRGAGKSHAAGSVIGKHLIEGKSGIGVAPIYTTLREVLIPSTLLFLDTCKIPYTYNKSESKITLKHNKASIIFISGTEPDRLRGFTEKSFLIIDEAVLCKEDVFTLGLACLRGQSVKKPQIYIISTPGGSTHWTSKLAKNDKNLFITATIFDNKYNGEVYIKNMLEQYKDLPDEFVRRELYGEIVDLDNNSMFTRTEWQKLIDTSTNYVDGPCIVGVDVGYGGDYSSICIIKGNEIKHIAKAITPELFDLKKFIIKEISGYKVDLMQIDRTGVGQNAPQEIQDILPDIDVRGVHFGSGSSKVGYANKRTEIHFDIKDRIKEGLHFSSNINEQIIHEIEEEMFSTCTLLNNKRDFIIAPKASVKSLLGRSPDILDSLALASFDIKSFTNQNELLRNLERTMENTNPFKVRNGSYH